MIIGTFTFYEDCALAQITRDQTLGGESSTVTNQVINNQPVYQIDGGAVRDTNLFHSFEQFSVPTGSTVYFNNTANIQNIISRVTGKSISNIDGTLRANSTANLFLLNPNGIIFGSNAALNIGGSFLASTASSLNFADSTKFSATNPQTTPLLTVSVPVGLQFEGTPGAIYNQSQASPNGATNSLNSPVGLQVQSGKTLALVGGDLILEGGNITAKQGRIELGSVAGNSLVNLNQANQGWSLGYENVQNFHNIQVIQRTQSPSYIDASGEGGGNIQVQSKRMLATGGSIILTNTLGSQPGGDLTVTASESVELSGFNTSLRARSLGSGNSGNLSITTGQLLVRDGAQVLVNSIGSGSAGQLTVNASGFVELLDGGYILPPLRIFIPSGLFSATSASGNGSDITVNTSKLRIMGGAQISAESAGLPSASRQFIPATGKGGNLTINVSDSIELIGKSLNNSLSSLSALTRGPGSAGNLRLTTGQLIVRDGATITVSSKAFQGLPYLGDPKNLGMAGDINITARSIKLDNQGILKSETDLGQGGNIALQVQDLLLMRHNSQISTSAGKAQGGGDGGNININAPNGFLVAAPLENSDITANAFSGSGGRVQINATSIFGFVPRNRADLVRLLQTNDPDKLDPSQLPTNDITAFSQQNPLLSGTVQIITPDVDPSRGLVELPANLVDASQQIITACKPGGKFTRASFVTTGRGGIAPSPINSLIADTVLADWITLGAEAENRATNTQNNTVIQSSNQAEKAPQKNNSVNSSTQIVEAQGWVVDANGQVHLVAQVPTVTPRSPTLNPTFCPVR
ncbi:MAG: S-layer family protein [Mojavia pulchra JT2-VF2]|jgi:filamentous hemagglutinin family protein|uniref:S-layer family protein n=1 Tax=Mojavia pulchra JT2-VF2 TaxID=287848 RepID=A0A951Q2D6_9NOST|nr:S-layer family protein [Mojavia pulchra JT2-VF2]